MLSPRVSIVSPETFGPQKASRYLIIRKLKLGKLLFLPNIPEENRCVPTTRNHDVLVIVFEFYTKNPVGMTRSIPISLFILSDHLVGIYIVNSQTAIFSTGHNLFFLIAVVHRQYLILWLLNLMSLSP